MNNIVLRCVFIFGHMTDSNTIHGQRKIVPECLIFTLISIAIMLQSLEFHNFSCILRGLFPSRMDNFHPARIISILQWYFSSSKDSSRPGGNKKQIAHKTILWYSDCSIDLYGPSLWALLLTEVNSSVVESWRATQETRVQVPLKEWEAMRERARKRVREREKWIERERESEKEWESEREWEKESEREKERQKNKREQQLLLLVQMLSLSRNLFCKNYPSEVCMSNNYWFGRWSR